MFDDEVIRGLDFPPPGLSSGEHFGGFEILEIYVVTLDQDLLIGALEIVSPLFHFLQNGQELPMVQVIVLFGGGAFPRVKIDWAKNPESIVLVKDAGDCEAACIGLQNDRSLRGELLEDRCFGKGLFELSKCNFGIPSPFPFP